MSTYRKRLTIPLLNKNATYIKELKDRYKEYKYISLSNLMIISTEYLLNNADESAIKEEIQNNFKDSYNRRKKKESDKIFHNIGVYMPKTLHAKLKDKNIIIYKLINVALDKFYFLPEYKQLKLIDENILERENKLSS